MTGDSSRVLRSSNGGWREQPLGVADAWRHQLRAVWGSSPSDVWVVGSNGETFHYDGHAFSSDFRATDTCQDASFAPDGEGWAASDHGLLRRDLQGMWSRQAIELEGPKPSDSFSAVLTVDGDVWAATSSEIMRRRAGKWQRVGADLFGPGTAAEFRGWCAIWSAALALTTFGFRVRASCITTTGAIGRSLCRPSSV